MNLKIKCLSLLINLFIFSSCLINPPKEEKSFGQEVYEEVVEEIEEKVLSDEWMEKRIQKKWYEGHEYIVMFSLDSRRTVGNDALGFIHNPNCPCNLEK